jgi:hypothetical protein
LTSIRSRVSTLLAEGAVVLISILIAFGLDASWDGRVIREQVREELVSVEAELLANRQSLAFHVDVAGRIVAASDEVVRRLDAAGVGEAVLVPDTLVAWILFSPSLDPSLGAVEALIASGQLSAVEDPMLRSTLAGLANSFDDAIEDQLLGRKVAFETMTPLAAGVSDLAAVTTAWTAWFANPSSTRPMVSPGETRIPASLEFKNAVLTHSFTYWLAASQMRAIDDELRTAIDRIQGLTR